MPTSTIRLPVAHPYDWDAALTFLARRAVTAVEAISGRSYARTVEHDAAQGVITVTDEPGGAALVLTIDGDIDADVAAQRVRRMFDLDADLAAVHRHLARDPFMCAVLGERLPPRVFKGWDGFEVAARTIVGQQVTVERARHVNGVVVARAGTHASAPGEGLTRLFPGPAQMLSADLSSLGMPGARAVALLAVARAAADDPRLFDRGSSLDETIARLCAVRDIGEWSAHYIAMRACGEPDAFPASDVGLLRGAAVNGRRPLPRELLERAEAWRPWRAYAAHVLWAADVPSSST